jgi:peptidoglycan/xylan/chitin deacetylase (PgdA/CDA1 family)
MTRLLLQVLYFSGLSNIYRHLFQRNKVSILLLHDPIAEDFENIMRFLSPRYNFISFSDYRAYRAGERELPDFSMILTFDDGHRRNYDLLPIFQRYACKPTIFLCSAIVGSHRQYWFNHEIPSDLKTRLKRLTNKERLESLKEIGYEKESEVKEREALSLEEINELKGSIELDAHTRFHPILPSCSDKEATEEIVFCREELKQRFNLDSRVFAYPNGDYSDRDIELCQSAGYELAVTVETGLNDRDTPPFELMRLSINDSAWIPELAVKSSGIWGRIRKPKIEKSIPWGN